MKMKSEVKKKLPEMKIQFRKVKNYIGIVEFPETSFRYIPQMRSSFLS